MDLSAAHPFLHQQVPGCRCNGLPIISRASKRTGAVLSDPPVLHGWLVVTLLSCSGCNMLIGLSGSMRAHTLQDVSHTLFDKVELASNHVCKMRLVVPSCPAHIPVYCLMHVCTALATACSKNFLTSAAVPVHSRSSAART